MTVSGAAPSSDFSFLDDHRSSLDGGKQPERLSTTDAMSLLSSVSGSSPSQSRFASGPSKFPNNPTASLEEENARLRSQLAVERSERKHFRAPRHSPCKFLTAT